MYIHSVKLNQTGNRILIYSYHSLVRMYVWAAVQRGELCSFFFFFFIKFTHSGCTTYIKQKCQWPSSVWDLNCHKWVYSVLRVNTSLLSDISGIPVCVPLFTQWITHCALFLTLQTLTICNCQVWDTNWKMTNRIWAWKFKVELNKNVSTKTTCFFNLITKISVLCGCCSSCSRIVDARAQNSVTHLENA